LRAYGRYYSDGGLSRKVRGLPLRTGRAVLERALTLYAILTDAETPLWARALVIAALGDFICPLDAIPDAFPMWGYADDAAVMALVLSRLERLLDGWKPGPRDPVRKTSPYLIGYDDLAEEIKEYDREVVRNMACVLGLIGQSIYRQVEDRGL
jgi:uncharacterized membrane protein YkvA (DUF1232 family)